MCNQLLSILSKITMIIATNQETGERIASNNEMTQDQFYGKSSSGSNPSGSNSLPSSSSVQQTFPDADGVYYD